MVTSARGHPRPLRGKGGTDESGAVTGVPAAVAAKASINLSKCKFTKTDVVTIDTTGLSTTSGSFVAVPGLSKTIKTGKGCVLVTLSAYPYAPSNVEYARVVIDGGVGAGAPSPSLTQFAAEDATYAAAHSAQFAFFVNAGTHTVDAQFASAIGGTVYMNAPSMVIDYK